MAKLIWDIHRWETDSVFQDLLEYGEMIEDQFNKLRAVDKVRVYSKPQGLSEEESVEWQAEVNYHEDRFESEFPRKIRYSFVILLHIMVETRLQAACDEIALRRQIQLTEADFRGGPIDRAKIFLTKVSGLQVCNSVSWQDIGELQKVRDCIVHANGAVEQSRDSR